MNTDIEQPKKPKHNKQLSTNWPVFVVPVTIAIVALALILTGLLYIGVKLPAERVVVSRAICSGSALLADINTYLELGDGDEDRDMATIIATIQSHSGYEQDATCVSALVYFYYQKSDSKNMEKYTRQLQQLSGKGQYPSLQLNKIMSLSDIEENLRVIQE